MARNKKKGSSFASPRKDAAERITAEEAHDPESTGGVAEMVGAGVGGLAGFIGTGFNPAAIAPGMMAGGKLGGLVDTHLIQEEPVTVESLVGLGGVATDIAGMGEMDVEAGDIVTEAVKEGKTPSAFSKKVKK